MYFNFAAYLGARILVSIASSMLTVAIGWHLFTYSGDPFDLALVGLLQIIPMILLFIVSGMVVDHFPRKVILVTCALLEAVVYIGLGFSMNDGELNRQMIFTLIFLHGTVRAFYSPASDAILIHLVTGEFFPKAVAVTSSMWTTAQTVGPLAAGLLLAWLDYDLYWILSGIVIAGSFMFLLLPNIRLDKPSGRGLKQILGGIGYVKSNPIVLPSISLDLFIVLCGSVMVLLPVYAVDVLHVDEKTLGVMRAMPALGGVMMGILLARLPAMRRAGKLLFIALSIFSLSILVFAYSTTLWISLLALWVYGASDMISVNIRSSLIQLATPDHLRGRVSAVNMLFIGISNEMGDFRGGAVAAVIGPVLTVLSGAALAFAVTLGGYMLFPNLRNLDKLTDAKVNDEP